MFFIVALGVLWLIHGYVAWRTIPAMGLSFSYTLLVYITVFIFSLLPVVPIVLRMSGNESKIIDKFSFLGYTSLGFFTLSFIFLFTKDFIIQFISIISNLVDTEQPIDNSKRDFIKKSITLGIIGISGTATGFGFYNSRKGPSVIKQDIFPVCEITHIPLFLTTTYTLPFR